MSFQLPIDPKSSEAGRFITSVHEELQNAYIESGVQKNKLAAVLGCDKSRVTRVLTGKENLTLRTLAEFAWALNYKPSFQMRKNNPPKGCNNFISSDAKPKTPKSTYYSGICNQQKQTSSSATVSTKIYGLIDG